MVKVQHFSERFEGEVAKLSEKVESVKRDSERKLKSHELVKHSIQSLAEESKGESASKENPSSKTPLPSYLTGSASDPKAREKIEKLVALFMEKGLMSALREAKKQTPFIEDAFHDTLVNSLLPELKKRGMLE